MNTPLRCASGAPPHGGAASGPAKPDPRRPLDDRRVTDAELSKLRWRCRRGLLENDLFIERFFARHADGLTVGQAAGLEALMDLSDNDLLDLLLARREPDASLALRPEALPVLAQLRARQIQ